MSILKRALKVRWMGRRQVREIEGENEVCAVSVVSDAVQAPECQPDVHLVRFSLGGVELRDGLEAVASHRLRRPACPARRLNRCRRPKLAPVLRKLNGLDRCEVRGIVVC